VLAIAVSQLVRNSSEWYRLFELAGITDTLIANIDRVYHPAMFSDRLLLDIREHVGGRSATSCVAAPWKHPSQRLVGVDDDPIGVAPYEARRLGGAQLASVGLLRMISATFEQPALSLVDATGLALAQETGNRG
jgi:hypothetical protein